MSVDWKSISGSGSLQRFARALRIALHDKQCEAAGPVMFCYDADVVVRIILGFEQFQDERKPSADPRHLLVRSLLSSGYLGHVALLRPHALELHQALSRKESFRGSEARGAYRSRLKNFLENQGIAEIFRSIVTGTIERVGPDRIQYFLLQMQEIAHASFVSIELANGSWQQRLTRLHTKGILRFEGDSTELREVLSDPLIWRFKEMIEASRRLDKRLSLSRLRDASALSILHELIQRFDLGKTAQQVRFFTEAEFLREAWERNPEMVQLLSYSGNEEGRGAKPDELFIGREVDYFILRAAFEALRFPGVEITSAPAVSLEELRDVSEELEALAHRAHSEVEDYLNSRRLGARPLVEHLGDFSSLSFLGSIWLNYEPPSLIREMVDGLEEVWRFGQEDEIEEALQQRIRQGAEEIQEALRDSIQVVDHWFETLDNVRDRVVKVFQKSELCCEIPPNPERDLGIVRWGIELSPESETQFKNFVRPLIGQDDQELHRGCIDLTNAILDVGDDLEKCTVVCVILWWLNGFRTLAKTVDRIEAELGGRELPHGLGIMRAAAKLQFAPYELVEREKLIRDQVLRVESLPGPEKYRYYVGLAYLYYRAWSSETHDKVEEVAAKDQSFLDGWIRESFSLAEKAENILPKDSLLWAFAVNHCAYVGAAAEIEPKKTDRYVRLLGGFEKRYNLWNYRFADTLAYYYLLLAERKHSAGKASKEVCQDLKTAASYLAQAMHCFADPAISSHRNQMIQLRSRVGCTDVEIPDVV